MKIRTKPVSSLIEITIVLVISAASVCGFEPFNPGREPAEVSAFDHLQPADRAVPEFRYLAQYWAQPQYEDQRYLVVLRDEASSRYYIEEGSPPKPQPIDQPTKPYKFKHRVEISPETAALIHEFWVNVLLQTRYDAKGLNVVVTSSTKFTFSTFVPNLGWMHGYTRTSTGDGLPPNWICDAGETLFAFVMKPKPSQDEQQLQKQIKADRDKVFEYMKTHGCP